MKFGKAKVRYARLVVPPEANGSESGAYLFFIGEQRVMLAKGFPTTQEVYFKRKINISGYTSMYSRNPKPEAFHFHAMDFDNLMTFLNAEKGNDTFSLEYWENNNSDLIVKHNLCRETLIIKGKKNTIYLGDVFDPYTTVKAVTGSKITQSGYSSYSEIAAIEVN